MAQTPTLIAYGSLMSGLGLASLAPLPVVDARRVRLGGCRRGFGKLSQYGDRFAMVLEQTEARAPIRSAPIAAADERGTDGDVEPRAGEPITEALAFTLPVPELARVAQREGYRADALLALARTAEQRGCGLGTHLWSLAEGVGFDVAAYRRVLADAVDYTSPHYVPHPVATAEGEPAIVFLPPGVEGSGRDTVVPIRVQTAETRLLTFRQAWSLKPNRSQLDYAAMCILAEVHGLALTDLVGDLRAPSAAHAAPSTSGSRRSSRSSRRARDARGLTAEQYAARFASEPRRAVFIGAA
jgi:hypothetical protein